MFSVLKKKLHSLWNVPLIVACQELTQVGKSSNFKQSFFPNALYI